MSIKQLQVLAWSNVVPSVTVKEDAVDKAITVIPMLVKTAMVVSKWVKEVNNFDRKPPTEADLREFVDLFGYDPYIGPVYRGCPLPDNTVLGNTTIKPEFKTTSWTTSKAIALDYAKYAAGPDRPRAKDNNLYGVISLASSGKQLMSTHWFKNCLEQVLRKHYYTVPELKALYRLYRGIVDACQEDDEVLMVLPSEIKVRVHKLVPAQD